MSEQLSPQMISILDDMLKPYEQQITQLKATNSNLQERLRNLQSGPQHSSEEFYNLQNELRNKDQIITQLKRRNGELETNLQNINSRSQLLDEKLRRANTDMSNNIRERKRYEDQISELQKRIAGLSYQEEQRKNKSDLDIKEKNVLNEQISRLVAMIKEYEITIEDMSNLNQKLKSVSLEKTQKIDALEEENAEYKKLITKLKRKMTNLQKGVPSADNEPEQDQSFQATTNFINIQAELEEANEKIKALKVRILALQEEERRNDRLTDALNKRNIMIENLQKQIDEKEAQILEYHRSKKDLIQKVETYRERVEEKHGENLNELEELRQQLQIYKEKYEIADKRVRKLEEESGQKMKETDELHRLLDQKLEGTHGLRQVVNEMKELRSMLDVRDRHIAELVSQINSMDKIMAGLCKQVDPNFNLEHFLKTYDTEDLDEEKIRTEKAARDLAKKIQMMKERGPTPQIRVVLNKDQRPIKTVFVEGDDESFYSPNQQHSKKNHRISDVNANDSIRVPPKQRHIIGQKRYKPDGDDEDEKENLPTFNEIAIQTDKVNAIGLDDDDDAEFSDGINNIDRDEWVVNLRRKYNAIRQERDDLKCRLDELLAKYEKLLADHNNLQSEISNPTNPKLSGPGSLSRSSFNLQFPAGQIVQYDRSNCTDRSTQTKKQKYKIEHQSIYSYSRKVHLSRVMFNDTKANAILLPSEEEKAIFNAKQNALKSELEKVRQEAADYKHQLAKYKKELEQLRELKDKMQETIDRLNQKLIEQREAYKEGLSQLRNEADRYAESQVKEALDVNRVQNRLNMNGNLGNLDGPNLDNVSTRMNELNHMKNRLEEQLNEERASSQLAQKQALHYRELLMNLEDENKKLKDELEKAKNDTKLTEYNAKLHIRMKNLEKKYRDLKEQYNELKSRYSKSDTKQYTEHPIDASDTEDQLATSKNFAVIRNSKTAEAKIMSLKTQNEEMQLKLGKAQGIIDRLNQLLQRKEGQVEKLKEQASAFKHQIIAKQKEVNSLRAKLQS